MLTSVAVIPARYDSSRFPGKPLAKETGKYLIQHVYEQVQVAPLINDVWVATDDQRIVDAVESFGGRAKMTSKDHPSGTDRVAEVAVSLDCDIVINVQGDEPEIEPVSISQLVEVLQQHDDCQMATLGCPFKYVPSADPQDPNAVKVQVSPDGLAIDFSRHELVAHRGWLPDQDPHPVLHLGVYAYRRDFLTEITTLAVTERERSERLEQLRVLDHGYHIAIALVRQAAVGVDTPQEYQAFVDRWNQRSHGKIRSES